MRNGQFMKFLSPVSFPFETVRGGACGFVCGTVLFSVIAVPVLGQQTKSSPEGVRACEPNRQAGGKKRQRKTERKTEENAAVEGSACLEIRQPALAVQEYLQEFVRQERWNIGEEEISEDAWTLAVYLKNEELDEYTKIPEDPKIDWRSGKALVNIRTSDAKDGFTRLMTTARFDGYGEPEDKFAPNRDSWCLPSKGVLEAKLINALKTRFARP